MIDYLSAYALLRKAGLNPNDCERGANLLSSIMLRPSSALVDDFITRHNADSKDVWEYLEATAKRGYE